ncbi:MAG: [Fe-Fe] hydrogenase large subunit C-terminal domain-containing protein [Eubacteriales bacterium]|nr:[Fe-Fe] hydrogenase large subunit C-terminal domain-containing protein [Eubacteriales bacterium]
MNESRFHSVRLDKDKCVGCTNCLKRCPTEAIRVRGGRAHIIDERCIDCGECIRVCDHHAKYAQTDPLSDIERFKYRIALPAPSLYGQFKHLANRSLILDGLIKIGFNEVFEVAEGADIVTRAIRERMRNATPEHYPFISSACPAIVRLIRVRFPELISHIVDIRQPMEVAAMVARREFCKKNEVAPENVGCFFITPCAAKMTAIKNPLAQSKSELDGAISMIEIYGLLASNMKNFSLHTERATATAYGVGWANSGGEAMAVSPEHSMAVDGIENVIRVLEEIENNKLRDLVFFEGAACTGGCVGGPLTFENCYVAKSAVQALISGSDRVHPDEAVKASYLTKYNLQADRPITPNSIMRLDDDIVEAMRKMEEMESIVRSLPGYDCGSCGSPTCRTFAEDIVRGYCNKMDCIHILKDQLKIMAQKMVELAKTTRE